MDPEILSEPRSSLWCSLEPDELFFRLESAAYLSVSAGRLNLPEKLPILWHKLYALLCCRRLFESRFCPFSDWPDVKPD